MVVLKAVVSNTSIPNHISTAEETEKEYEERIYKLQI